MLNDRRFVLRTLIGGVSALALLAAPAAADEYQYDSLGRLIRVTYDNGAVVQYAYDAAGNRSSVISTLPNAAPVAVNDSASFNASTAVDIMVRANDSDPNGDPLTVTAVGAPTGGGSVAIQGGGSHVRYTAPATGGIKTFTYTVSDGQGGTATATVTVNVLNSPPGAVNDSASVNASAAVDIMVRANDSDPNGDPLTVTAVGAPTGGGAAMIQGGGTHVRYTAPSTGGTKAFTYTVSDGQAGTATATVTVNVTVPNSPPIAVNDSAGVNASTAVDVMVRANDSDPNGDPLTVTAVGTPTGGGAAVIPGGGTHVRYTAPATGGAKTFTYTISDGQGGTATATVTVNVTVPNSPPVAVADTGIEIERYTTDYIYVLSNDSDPDGHPLMITSVTGAGASIGPGGGYIVYAAGAIGFKTLTYTISDGYGGTSTAHVEILVYRP